MVMFVLIGLFKIIMIDFCIVDFSGCVIIVVDQVVIYISKNERQDD